MLARTRNAVKRQKVATVQSALFNSDVALHQSALLDVQDLCQVSLTCKALGGKRADVFGGLSLAEEAARQLFEQSVTEWEISCLLKYDGLIELYRHLLMLRSNLTFDQLVGDYIIDYGEDILFSGLHFDYMLRPLQQSRDEIRQALCYLRIHSHRRIR
ncbi:hypothetical protein THAOC_32945 [Thalassiosira oceanica]|uniref:Uncharacterized protein n=1 Tax=Thalassiosira oceanica TaxID=159749 RepID=K0R669_THAOC|nr:hypothetical protein THAOC_32945 [Thalassiosira oceanica]|eukprot:EJK48275.1 hypothetical protein THAOC_32945 [Thalassiosira oceanica]